MTIKTPHVKICGTLLKQDLTKINGFNYIYQKTRKMEKNELSILTQEFGEGEDYRANPKKKMIKRKGIEISKFKKKCIRLKYHPTGTPNDLLDLAIDY